MGFYQHQYIYLLSVPDCPLITNEELAGLPVVQIFPSGNYTGSKLQSTIQKLRGVLEQGVPSKEIEVSGTSVKPIPKTGINTLFFVVMAK